MQFSPGLGSASRENVLDHLVHHARLIGPAQGTDRRPDLGDCPVRQQPTHLGLALPALAPHFLVSPSRPRGLLADQVL
jgi:hypothetical protein